MKSNENDYIEQCKKFSLEYVGYHSEPHKGRMVEFICPKHKDKGVQSIDWSHFHIYAFGCPYCSGRYKTTEEIQKQIDDFNLNTLLISEYTGNEKSIKCKCKICNNIWMTKPKVLLTNKSACPKCGRIKANFNESCKQEDVEERLNQINPFIKIIGKYTGTHRYVECECNICGCKFNGMPARLLRGEAGCPKCNLSDGERKMIMLLDKLNIKYERQYIIPECRNKLPLRFDAFDTTNNVGFEYNGEQHYHPIYIKSRSYDSIKEFDIIQKRDNIKIEFCKKNNIPLIIIPYWEKDNMEEYVLKEFRMKGVYC